MIFAKYKQYFLPAILIALVLTGWLLLPSRPYNSSSEHLPPDFEQFYKNRLKISKNKQITAQKLERLIQVTRDNTAPTLLYIPDPEEDSLQPGIERLARGLGMNTYVMRLPMQKASPQDIEQVARESLLMMSKLGTGKTLLLAGQSGAVPATHLAARFPDLILGLVLLEPRYAYADSLLNLTRYPLVGLFLSEGISLEEVRVISRMNEGLVDRALFRNIRIPVLIFLRSGKTQQPLAADRGLALDIFHSLGRRGRPHYLNRAILLTGEGGSILQDKYNQVLEALVALVPKIK